MAERNSDSVVPPSDLRESCGFSKPESSSYCEDESEEGKRRRWSIGGRAVEAVEVEGGGGAEGPGGGKEGGCATLLRG